MTAAPPPLVAILDLEPLERNMFRGLTPPTRIKRVFGGQVVAQALVAACRTVEGRVPHSLHAYFLLGGDPSVPIIYDVERIRDGRSFTTRRVVAIQHGEAIFTMAVSFHNDEPGPTHQLAMPVVPPPEDLPGGASLEESLPPALAATLRRYFAQERSVEIRPVELSRYHGTPVQDGKSHAWMRITGRLPDSDPLLHRYALAYASDLLLLDSALAPLGRTLFSPTIMAASLDHALWFHRPFRADEWLLYAQDSPILTGARGFARGLFYDREGRLVASVAQEGLLREITPRADDPRQPRP